MGDLERTEARGEGASWLVGRRPEGVRGLVEVPGEDGSVWDALTDVVVVGAEVAGLVAAFTAHEAGAEVVVVTGARQAARARPNGDGALAWPVERLPGPPRGAADALALGRLGVVDGRGDGRPEEGGGGLAHAAWPTLAAELGWHEGLVEALVHDRFGGVLGVRVAREGARPKCIRALRGVVLVSTRDSEDAAGDGLLLGLSAGGVLAEGLSATIGCPATVVGTNDTVNGLWVNAAGERFVAEDAHHTTAMRAVERQPGGRAFAVFDAATAALGGDVLGALLGGFSRDLRDELSLGLIARARSWELLGETLGIDSVGLPRTISAWNEDMARHGRDLRFGRVAALRPIGDGPCHGLRVTPVRLERGGGLRVNTEGQVVDQRQHPIPGLYAAGEAAASFIGAWYPRSGAGLAGLVLGRRAGAHAAELGALPPAREGRVS